jgi:predicted DNA-binding transcriptional regulator AlpA
MDMQRTVLLTEREVAQRLRLGANTLAKWRIRGEGPRFIKIGARIRYDEREVADWVASCRRASTSQTEAAA